MLWLLLAQIACLPNPSERPATLRGQVDNQSTEPVLVWTSESCCAATHSGFYELAPGERSPAAMDADHVQDRSGQWWKVGASECVVSDHGVQGCRCKVSDYREPCP